MKKYQKLLDIWYKHIKTFNVGKLRQSHVYPCVASPLPLTDIHSFLGKEESGLCIIAFELLNSQRSLNDFIEYAKFILMTHSLHIT